MKRVKRKSKVRKFRWFKSKEEELRDKATSVRAFIR
jgi:hypothetical protein